MDSIEEKRVYGDREGATCAYVASSIGVVRVRVAGDAIGEFDLCDRRTAVDATAADGTVAIATDEDVRVLDEDGEAADDAVFVDTGFGPATAVGGDESRLLAADADGRVAVREADGGWTTLAAEFEPSVRAIDGDLLATDRGVYRLYDGGLDHAGLSDVTDVSARGVPLAATAEGLFKLGNGWMEVFDGPVDAVAADPRSEPGSIARAHAVVEGAVLELDPERDEWRTIELPADGVVDVAYGEAVYAVADDGTFLAATDGSWRSQLLGVPNVAGLAVPFEV